MTGGGPTAMLLGPPPYLTWNLFEGGRSCLLRVSTTLCRALRWAVGRVRSEPNAASLRFSESPDRDMPRSSCRRGPPPRFPDETRMGECVQHGPHRRRGRCDAFGDLGQRQSVGVRAQHPANPTLPAGVHQAPRAAITSVLLAPYLGTTLAPVATDGPVRSSRTLMRLSVVLSRRVPAVRLLRRACLALMGVEPTPDAVWLDDLECVRAALLLNRAPCAECFGAPFTLIPHLPVLIGTAEEQPAVRVPARRLQLPVPDRGHRLRQVPGDDVDPVRAQPG